MNVTIEDISSVKKKLSFEVPTEQVDAAIEKAYQKIAKKAKVKGFRPGKVPRRVLENNYAAQAQSDAFQQLINESYPQALVDKAVFAVSDPQITESSTVASGQAFTYVAEVEIKPEVEARDYVGFELEKEVYVGDDQAVDSRLEEMLESRATMEPTTRKKARQGDFVVIDFAGSIDGAPFAGGSATGHQLELGSNIFIPGFEEQIEGMKRDEERNVEVTFPEEYGNKELAGKAAIFKVTMQEINEKVVPKLDDKFAQGFGMETVEALRQQLTQIYSAQEVDRINSELRERMMAKLVERNNIEVPAAMVDSQLDYMLDNTRNRMKQQGMSLEMLGMSDASFRQMYRDAAVKQVQGSLLLEAVVRQEKIEVVDGDFDEKLAKVAEMAGAPLDVVKKHYASAEARRGLSAQIAEEKAIELILEKAHIKEVTKDELAAKQDAIKE
ncbi:MAG: trigger factor [Desulfuromonadales bacterium]|nr:trigger factor [Desulfuromonadales bacterium]MDT8423100.1 trigger factor [Desulfuromonadales bacterium]